MREEEAKRLRAVEAPGHRSGIRALALSSDDAVLLSAAAGAVKLWNPTSGACLRTIETGQVLLSSLFFPGFGWQTMSHSPADDITPESCILPPGIMLGAPSCCF